MQGLLPQIWHFHESQLSAEFPLQRHCLSFQEIRHLEPNDILLQAILQSSEQHGQAHAEPGEPIPRLGLSGNDQQASFHYLGEGQRKRSLPERRGQQHLTQKQPKSDDQENKHLPQRAHGGKCTWQRGC